MGYYTDFNLTVESAPGQIADIEAIDDAISTNYDWVFDDMEFGSYYGNATWYDWRDDMVKLSRQFPKAVFYLEGHGESEDDIWGWYFMNGWVQTDGIEICYNHFDPAKMERWIDKAPSSPLLEPNPTIDAEQLDKLLMS